MAKPNLALTLAGWEKIVDNFISRKREIEKLEELQAGAEDSIIQAARDTRNAEEEAGKFYKSVRVLGKKFGDLCVVFANKFGEIDLAHADLLQRLLGTEIFHQSFIRKVKLQPKHDLTMANIEAKIGKDAVEKLKDLIEFREFLGPVKPFMELRAKMRSLVDEGTNEQIDQLIEHVQAKPSVREVEK